MWTLKNQQTVNKQINLLRHVLLKKFCLPYEFQNYLERRKSRKPMETLAMRSSFTLCWEPSCNTNWDQSGKNQLGSSSVTDAAALKTRGARERTQAQSTPQQPAALTTKPQVAQNWKMMNEDLLIHIWK